MKSFLLLIALILGTGHAVAAEAAATAKTPVVVVPAPKVDIKKLKLDIAKLTVDEKRSLIASIKRQLPPTSAEEKAEKQQASIERWESMTPGDRNEYRARYAASWAKMSPETKKIQREKLRERLQALPASDRQMVLLNLNEGAAK